MTFATLDRSRIKGGTAIGWCWWPDTRGETLTSIRGCKWAKYFDAAAQKWVYYETCASCYAQVTAHSLCTRFDSPHYAGLTKATARGPIWNGEIRFDEEQLLSVLRRTSPVTFFCTSVGDLAYKAVPDEVIVYHFAVMTLAHWHRFLILTKRPDRLAKLTNSPKFWADVNRKIHELEHRVPKRQGRGRLVLVSPTGRASDCMPSVIPTNIWFGTSIENKASACWALNELMKVPAPGRLWTSFEPMLEYVDLTPWLTSALPLPGHPNLPNCLSWVVLGGPSKQGRAEAPFFSLPDAYRVINDCAQADVAAHLKQIGANPVEPDGQLKMRPYRCAEHNNHNDDPQHWPSQLRVQQFPVAA